MESSLLIPHYPPLPFPAPLWLLLTLLILGLFLHMLPMNMMVGSTFLSAFFLSKGMGDKKSFSYRIGKGLAKGLPIFVSFAVTQGIVPLLFLQLIYGPMYYTSSTIIAVPWISVLALLLGAYALSYVVVYKCLEAKNPHAASAAPSILVVGGLMMLVVGLIFVNNMTLMLHPEKWLAMYQHSCAGLNMNMSDEQVPSRYCHFLLSALAVGGLTMGAYGLYFNKREHLFGQWLIKTGARIYGLFTFLNIGAGLWFLTALPSNHKSQFVGHDKFATAVFALSMALTAVSWLTAVLAAKSGSPKAFRTSLVSGCLVILAMIVNRHQLRTAFLSGVLNPNLVPVQTQWDLLIVFIVSAVALVIYMIWITKLVFKALSERAVPLSESDTAQHTEFAT